MRFPVVMQATSRNSLTDPLKQHFIWYWYVALRGLISIPITLPRIAESSLLPFFQALRSGLYWLMNINESSTSE
jgi:hypothetical protein